MDKVIEITIPYGKEEAKVNVPAKNLLGVFRIKNPPGLKDVKKELEKALNNPIRSDRIEHIGSGAKKIVIACDDNTRPTPTHLILPFLLDRLIKAGLKRSSIKVIMALGTHRPMTPTEIKSKVGDYVLSRVEVINHNWRDPRNLVFLGKTSSGILISVNREVMEADLVIGVGNIVPHRYSGWAGGAKIIQPGVCGEETTAGTHLMVTNESVKLGKLDNIVMKEIKEVAREARLKFIINTVMNQNQEVVAIVAGDFVKTHTRGVERARQVYGVRIPKRAEIVVAGSYPADLNLWQAGKALYSADLVVKEGGTIILFTPAYEGIGEHKEFASLLKLNYGEILKRINKNKVEDRVSAAAALAVSLVSRRANIVIVSDGLTEEEVEMMSFKKYSNLQEAVDAALGKYGKEAKLIFLPEGSEILPFFY